MDEYQARYDKNTNVRQLVNICPRRTLALVDLTNDLR